MTPAPDTPLGIAVKIARMEVEVQRIAADLGEVRADTRRIFERLDHLSTSQAQVTALLDLVNANSLRSDERWKEAQHSRSTDLAEWYTWRASVDAHKTGLRLLVLGFVALAGGFWMAGQYFVDTLRSERQANSSVIVKNTDRIRNIENHIASKYPDYRPAQ